jgi:hypothetical protein
MIAAGPAQGERITNAAQGRPKLVHPPRGAAQHTKWQARGLQNAAQGRPKQVHPPRGAESHTQWANVGVHIS